MVVQGEAIVIVLDVGKSMQDNKICPTALEDAKICINRIIQRKIFSESKDEIGLILFGTSDTEGIAEEYCDEYINISVLQDLRPASWELFELVNKVESTDIATDYIRANALLSAINLLQNTTSKKKFASRRILFLSCFDGSLHSDKVDEICDELSSLKIDLNVIGPFAFPTEDIKDESLIQVKAENCISKILQHVNGESYTFSDVLPALSYFQNKQTQPRPWNADLDFGLGLSIPVSAYIKVTEGKLKSWKIAYAFKPTEEVKRESKYYVNDVSQTNVSKGDVITAFKYGTTLVPYSEEDKSSMDYQSGERGMKVLGFTKAETVHRFHYVGDKSMYVFGHKNKEGSGETLAAFIQALHETKMVAIVRYVYSPRSAPKIGFLTPKIKESYECLVFIILPFMEDVRHLYFTALDSDSRNIPTEEQINAIDDLITAMDLTVPVEEDDGEILKPRHTVNPYIQRLYQCLQFKAFYPEKPLPNIEPHIEALLNPPPKLLKRAEKYLENVKSLFPTKEVVVKKTVKEHHIFSNGNSDESSKKHSASDSASEEKVVTEAKLADVVTDKIDEVGSINPVRDFQYLINNKVIPFNDACGQLMNVVFKFLQDDAQLRIYHSKIISICKEFRRTSLEEGNAEKYNFFMTKLQNLLLECDEDLWDKIRNEKIGLISKEEIPSSEVSSEEAAKFLANPSSEVKNSVDEAMDTFEDNDEFDDLMGQL